MVSDYLTQTCKMCICIIVYYFQLRKTICWSIYLKLTVVTRIRFLILAAYVDTVWTLTIFGKFCLQTHEKQPVGPATKQPFPEANMRFNAKVLIICLEMKQWVESPEGYSIRIFLLFSLSSILLEWSFAAHGSDLNTSFIPSSVRRHCMNRY